MTAFVGPSGCGKTTVLRLISRLYDYDNGKILIGGKEIANIDIDCFLKIFRSCFKKYSYSIPVLWKISEWEKNLQRMKK